MSRLLHGELAISKNFTSQKNQGVEGLLLCGRCYIAFNSQIIEIISNRLRPSYLRSLLEADQAKSSEPNAPLDVGLLGGVTVTRQPNRPTKLFSKTGNFVINFWKRFGRWNNG